MSYQCVYLSSVVVRAYWNKPSLTGTRSRRLAWLVRPRTVELHIRIEEHNHANCAYRRWHPAYADRNCLVLSGYQCAARQLYDGANAMGGLRSDRVSHRCLCVLASAAHFQEVVTTVSAGNI